MSLDIRGLPGKPTEQVIRWWGKARDQSDKVGLEITKEDIK